MDNRNNKHLAIFSSAVREVVVIGISFFTGVLVARWLGPKGRGEYAIVILWPTLLVQLGSLGLREAFVFYQAKGTYRSSDLNTAAFIMATIQSMALVGIGWIALPILLKEQQHLLPIARLYLLYIPCFLYVSYLQGLMQGRMQIFLFNLIRASTNIIYLIAIILFNMFLSLEVATVAISMLVSIGLVLSISFLYALFRYGFSSNVSGNMAKNLVNYGLRNHVGNISKMVNGRLDQMLMALFLEPKELGWYVIAVSVSSLVQFGSSSIAVFLFPRTAQTEDAISRRNIIHNNMRVSLTLSLCFGIIFSLLAPFAIPIIYSIEYFPSIAPAMILILAAVFLGINQNLSASLQGTGKPEALSKAETLGLIVTGLSLWAFLPSMGIIGAAIASLLAYSSTFLYLGVQLSRSVNIPMRELFRPIKFPDFVHLILSSFKNLISTGRSINRVVVKE